MVTVKPYQVETLSNTFLEGILIVLLFEILLLKVFFMNIFLQELYIKYFFKKYHKKHSSGNTINTFLECF